MEQSKLKRIAAISAAAASLAAGYEGMSLYPYRDMGGVLTVCDGETHNVQHRKYSKQECLAMLNDDMRRVVLSVDSCLPDLPDNILLSVSDLAYNEGTAKVCSGIIYKLLSEKRYTEACNELLEFNHVDKKPVYGLTKRRESEREVCLNYQ